MGFWLVVLGTILRCAYSAPPPVQVYTGVLEHSAIGKYQNVRLFILSYEDLSPTIPGIDTNKRSAILTLHWGDFDPIEYVSLYYSTIPYNAQTHTYFLGYASTDLPKIQLVRSGSDDSLSGTYISPTLGAIGMLRLYPGWEIPANIQKHPRLVSWEGTYTGHCPTADHTHLPLAAIEVVPTRMGIPAQETPLRFMNYVGTAICDHDGFTACGAFGGGINDFYHDELILYQSGWTWTCRHADENEIVCDSPRYKECRLKRRARGAEFPSVSVSNPVHTVASASNTKEDAAWDGEYEGVLTHHVTGKQQYLSLRLTTAMLSGPNPPVRILLSGELNLFFGSEFGSLEKIRYTFPGLEINPKDAVEVLSSPQGQDAIVQIGNVQGDILEGNYYSKLYGWVGSFSLQRKSPVISHPPLASFVPSLSGDYTLQADENWTMRFFGTTLLQKPGDSFNPYYPVPMSGWIKADIGEFPALTVETSTTFSYDFFSGWLVTVFDKHFYAGTMRPDGFTYLPINTLFLSMSRPPGEPDVMARRKR